MTINAVPLGDLNAEDNNFDYLKFEEFSFYAQAGQSYWVIGSGPTVDVLFPKTNIMLGASLVLYKHEGKFFIKDITCYDPLFEPMLKLITKRDSPLQVGQVVSIGQYF